MIYLYWILGIALGWFALGLLAWLMEWRMISKQFPDITLEMFIFCKGFRAKKFIKLGPLYLHYVIKHVFWGDMREFAEKHDGPSIYCNILHS